MEVYLVGGAVRDALLGQAVHDKDFVVVGATPNQLLELGFHQIGADFPVFLHPDTHHEYALARTERKVGAGYQGFCVQTDKVTLAEDLFRRDLTINAMAIPVAGLFDDTPIGEIIDPYGGQKDLTNKILRHISQAFCEDPLRVLRVARFYARLCHQGFKVADSTKSMMAAIAKSGELSHLSRERLWAETAKALGERSSFAYFELLDELQILSIIVPDLATAWRDLLSLKLDTFDALKRADGKELVVKFGVLISSLVAYNEGLAMLKSSVKALKVPNTIARVATLFLGYHHIIQNIVNHTATAEQVVMLIEAAKAQRDDTILRQVCQIFMICYRTQDPNILIKRYLVAYQSVGMHMVDDTLQGRQIGEALTKLRQQAISRVME